MNIAPYIYEPEKSVEVYKTTSEYLTKNSNLKDKIWDNLFSGHFFPFTESWDEIQISYNLICFGLYKQAFVSLRSGLELGMLSVYYNINDEGHKMVKDWLLSKETYEANTPRASSIWKVLLSNENIRIFDEKHDLKSKFNELGFLHNYVHTKGSKLTTPHL